MGTCELPQSQGAALRPTRSCWPRAFGRLDLLGGKLSFVLNKALNHQYCVVSGESHSGLPCCLCLSCVKGEVSRCMGSAGNLVARFDSDP